MGLQVVNNALCKCSFGMAPSPIGVLPVSCTMSASQPSASIMDNVPFLNIKPFATCMSPGNPAVIAAMMAPVPCTPVPAGPWIVGVPTAMVGNKPTLDNSSMLICSFGGVINVLFSGQVQEMA